MTPEEIRRIKTANKTAIPAGVYKVTVNMSPSGKRTLPQLSDVPGFGVIPIHRGNTADDSGCIIVGENRIKGMVINSARYELYLVETLLEAQERGEEITIEIMNSSIVNNE
jgi:hypothetical protein